MRRREASGALVYELRLAPLPSPFRREYTEWRWEEVAGFLEHLAAGGVFGVFPAGATPSADRCAGLVEVEYDPESQAANLVSLFVDRKQRGQGAGRMLLDQAIQWACGHAARAVLVATQVSNVPAIQFYQQAGFRLCGLHEMLYTNDDAAHHETTVYLALPLT